MRPDKILSSVGEANKRSKSYAFQPKSTDNVKTGIKTQANQKLADENIMKAIPCISAPTGNLGQASKRNDIKRHKYFQKSGVQFVKGSLWSHYQKNLLKHKEQEKPSTAP